MSDYNEVFDLNRLEVGTPTNTDPFDDVKPAIRQVKFLMKHLLREMFDSSGNLKPFGASILSDSIISAQHLGEGVVLGDKLANGSVTIDKVQDGAIGNSKLANGAVTLDKLSAGSVSVDKLIGTFLLPPEKIANGISGGKIKDNTLSGAKLAEESVPSSKLASVDPVKINSATGSGGYILVTNSDGFFNPVQVSGDISLVAGGGIKITKVQGCLEIADKKTSGSSGGQYTGAGSWVKRSFSSISTVNFASVNNSEIVFSSAGTTVEVDISVCASGSTGHQARLVWTDGVATTIVIVGTSAEGETPSRIKGRLVSVNNGHYEIQMNGTWGASSGVDFGKPVGKGEEVYLTGTITEL